MEEWIYSKPEFECDKLNYDLLKYAPWSGHRSFAYDFMNYFRPDVLVELGSHYGCSAFAFTQAAKDFDLDTRLCFVDTWEGDDFTRKYNNDVYTVFSQTVESFYSNQNIEMMRMTFDEALDKFENKSIDVLHIDGSHHYDDVKGDFEKWLPKVNDNGIILLHDISKDIVLGNVMGSYKYWKELKKKYKYTAEFDFSWGLGIIFLNGKMYKDFIENVSLKKYQRNNNALDVEYKDVLRQNYFRLKDDKIYIDDLLKQKEVLQEHIKAYEDNTKKYESQLKENAAAYENERNQIVKDYEDAHNKTVESYESSIKTITEEFDKRALEIQSSYEQTISGKDSYIAELERAKAEMTETIAALEEAVAHPVKYRLNRLKSKK